MAQEFRICAACAGGFFLPDSRRGQSRRKYCGECRVKQHNARSVPSPERGTTPKRPVRTEAIPRPCGRCGESFRPPLRAAMRKYCDDCRYITQRQRAESHGWWKWQRRQYVPSTTPQWGDGHCWDCGTQTVRAQRCRHCYLRHRYHTNPEARAKQLELQKRWRKNQKAVSA